MQRKLCLAMLVLVVGSGVAQAESYCGKDYRLYFMHGNLHAAIATVDGRDPRGTDTPCGWADGEPTVQKAISGAILGCERWRTKEKKASVCKPFASK